MKKNVIKNKIFVSREAKRAYTKENSQNELGSFAAKFKPEIRLLELN